MLHRFATAHLPIALFLMVACASSVAAPADMDGDYGLTRVLGVTDNNTPVQAVSGSLHLHDGRYTWTATLAVGTRDTVLADSGSYSVVSWPQDNGIVLRPDRAPKDHFLGSGDGSWVRFITGFLTYEWKRAG